MVCVSLIRFLCPSVPVPTLVSLCSTRFYKRRNQRDTSNSMMRVWFWILTFLRRTRRNAGRNVKSATLTDLLFVPGRPLPAMDAEAHKRAAAARALEFVQPGMRLGLGTGSTARHFIVLLAERVRAAVDVLAVPTSEATRVHADHLGMRLSSLDGTPH